MRLCNFIFSESWLFSLFKNDLRPQNVCHAVYIVYRTYLINPFYPAPNVKEQWFWCEVVAMSVASSVFSTTCILCVYFSVLHWIPMCAGACYRKAVCSLRLSVSHDFTLNGRDRNLNYRWYSLKESGQIQHQPPHFEIEIVFFLSILCTWCYLKFCLLIGNNGKSLKDTKLHQSGCAWVCPVC